MAFAEILKSTENARNCKKSQKISKTDDAPNARAHRHPNQDSKVISISIPNDEPDIAPDKERALNCAPEAILAFREMRFRKEQANRSTGNRHENIEMDFWVRLCSLLRPALIWFQTDFRALSIERCETG
jgi:hypothetical protein